MWPANTHKTQLGWIDCWDLLIMSLPHFFYLSFYSILIHDNHTLFIQKINTFLSSCGGELEPPFLPLLSRFSQLFPVLLPCLGWMSESLDGTVNANLKWNLNEILIKTWKEILMKWNFDERGFWWRGTIGHDRKLWWKEKSTEY